MTVEALHFGCATQLLFLVFGAFHVNASQCLLLAAKITHCMKL